MHGGGGQKAKEGKKERGGKKKEKGKTNR